MTIIGASGYAVLESHPGPDPAAYLQGESPLARYSIFCNYAQKYPFPKVNLWYIWLESGRQENLEHSNLVLDDKRMVASQLRDKEMDVLRLRSQWPCATSRIFIQKCQPEADGLEWIWRCQGRQDGQTLLLVSVKEEKETCEHPRYIVTGNLDDKSGSEL